jgi:hypothetical protein
MALTARAADYAVKELKRKYLEKVMRKLKWNDWWWKNAFIAIHRAANMDGLIELHCGAFSSNPQTSIESGRICFSRNQSVTALIMKC